MSDDSDEDEPQRLLVKWYDSAAGCCSVTLTAPPTLHHCTPPPFTHSHTPVKYRTLIFPEDAISGSGRGLKKIILSLRSLSAPTIITPITAQKPEPWGEGSGGREGVGLWGGARICRGNYSELSHQVHFPLSSLPLALNDGDTLSTETFEPFNTKLKVQWLMLTINQRPQQWWAN